ncbi:hypothetical protein MMUR_05500 [Mycolicibacterium murale]|uniref:Uncharacterized protein n=1 Tax=Mycolicibacterium murale TaxID=182220 RepID=A0A7I9WFE9_9MYCO|nr:hypothetical protein [Mycolicibacterium murale]MCV7182864.1 hypothetical protein [Mycolicibacterium murale]GFG56414.1 hypothetical protein MMUR_05500 [Mycolicibacterium murale]
MKTTTDLLRLRWRVAQWFLALSDGEVDQAASIVRAMGVEGFTRTDMLDEFALLRAQFGHRQRHHLVAEISRLWGSISVRCSRCERQSPYRDSDGVCWLCVLEEPA